jgi:superoxide dismutase, Fe-Mn family
VAWSDFQNHVIENLNRVAANTDYESMSLVKTIAQTARIPDQAALYNYAALAFSNHFFFDSIENPLTPSSERNQEMPKEIVDALQESFSTVDVFRQHIKATALAMVGSGWVWVVLDHQQKLCVLATYNAGTPFDFARLQQADPNTGLIPGKGLSEKNDFALYQAMKRPYSLTPLLCVSCWEHSYLVDYGVDGKGTYIDNWLDSIDWAKMRSRLMEAKNANSRGMNVEY